MKSTLFNFLLDFYNTIQIKNSMPADFDNIKENTKMMLPKLKNTYLINNTNILNKIQVKGISKNIFSYTAIRMEVADTNEKEIFSLVDKLPPFYEDFPKKISQKIYPDLTPSVFTEDISKSKNLKTEIIPMKPGLQETYNLFGFEIFEVEDDKQKETYFFDQSNNFLRKRKFLEKSEKTYLNKNLKFIIDKLKNENRESPLFYYNKKNDVLRNNEMLCRNYEMDLIQNKVNIIEKHSNTNNKINNNLQVQGLELEQKRREIASEISQNILVNYAPIPELSHDFSIGLHVATDSFFCFDFTNDSTNSTPPCPDGLIAKFCENKGGEDINENFYFLSVLQATKLHHTLLFNGMNFFDALSVEIFRANLITSVINQINVPQYQYLLRLRELKEVAEAYVHSTNSPLNLNELVYEFNHFIKINTIKGYIQQANFMENTNFYYYHFFIDQSRYNAPFHYQNMIDNYISTTYKSSVFEKLDDVKKIRTQIERLHTFFPSWKYNDNIITCFHDYIVDKNNLYNDLIYQPDSNFDNSGDSNIIIKPSKICTQNECSDKVVNLNDDVFLTFFETLDEQTHLFQDSSGKNHGYNETQPLTQGVFFNKIKDTYYNANGQKIELVYNTTKRDSYRCIIISNNDMQNDPDYFSNENSFEYLTKDELIKMKLQDYYIFLNVENNIINESESSNLNGNSTDNIIIREIETKKEVSNNNKPTGREDMITLYNYYKQAVSNNDTIYTVNYDDEETKPSNANGHVDRFDRFIKSLHTENYVESTDSEYTTDSEYDEEENSISSNNNTDDFEFSFFRKHPNDNDN